VWRDVVLRSAGSRLRCCWPFAMSGWRAAPMKLALARLGWWMTGCTPRLLGGWSAAIGGVKADPAFAEAFSWQNPVLAEFLRGTGPGSARRAKDRKREVVVASYLQRYCLKNDTIGVFGPVGWVSVEPAGRAAPWAWKVWLSPP
jgi:hypothetical protein